MALSALKLRPADCVLPLDEIAEMLRTLDAGAAQARTNWALTWTLSCPRPDQVPIGRRPGGEPAGIVGASGAP